MTETLFGSLKVERLHGMRFDTRHVAKDDCCAAGAARPSARNC